MTLPQGNASTDPIDTHRITVQQWIEQVPLLLDGRGRARHNLRRFVVYLATFASPDGTDIFPSVDRVAEHMHCSRRTVFRLYREAEQAKQIIREGHSRKGTIRVRLNLDLAFTEGWLPYDAAAEHRLAKQREYTARWREKKAKGDAYPLTRTDGGDTNCLTASSGEGVCVTQPSIFEHHENQLHSLSAAADATTPGLDERAEEAGEAILPVLADSVQLSTPKAAAAAGVTADKVRKLVAAGQLTPSGRDGRGRASWLVSDLQQQLAQADRSNRISAPILSGPISASTTIERTPEARKAGKLYDPTLWPTPRPEYYETDRGLIVQKLVGDWIDTVKEHRATEPGGSDIGRAGKEIRQALTAGNNPNHVWEAVKLAAREGSPWIWGAMAKTHRAVPASAPQNVSRTKARVTDCAHGRFEVPAGLSRGDELTVSLHLGRTVLRPEHWETLAVLGVRKIA